MAVKKKTKPVKPQSTKAVAASIKQVALNDIVYDSMIRYGTYTVEDRAIPSIQDGLKPVQRRVLWAMNDLGAKDSGYKVKCAKVVGQCFVAGTPVTTDKGEIAIEKIKVGDRVATRSGFNVVEETFKRNPEPTIIVYFKDKQLACTPDHKFLTLKKGEVKLKWVEARNLTKKHMLVSMDLMERDFSLTYKRSLAYLAGHFAGNGSYSSDGRISFVTPFEKSYLQVVKHLSNVGISIDFERPTVPYNKELYKIRLTKAKSLNLAKQLKISNKQKADTKSINNTFLSVDTAAFTLAGLIDTDGHVKNNRLVFCSTSEKLMAQYSYLISLFGETGKIHSVDPETANSRVTEFSLVKNHNFKSYWNEVYGQSCYNIMSKIPSSKVVETAESFRTTDIGLARVLKEKIESRKAGLGPSLQGHYYSVSDTLVKTSLRYKDTNYIYRIASTVSVSTLLKTNIIEVLEDLEENKLAIQLQKLTNYNFTPVSKIKKGPVAVTYDIRVENKHEFIANGVIVHNCMGSYHPHGDQAIYDALVRFVTNIPTPIIHGEGNFGSHNDPPAAYRYTTCHFTKFGFQVYFNPYYTRVIETVPNYDGSTKEPVVLPALLPMALIIPQSGIAVGVSTNVPSFTVDSIYKTISLMFKTGKIPSGKWLAKNLEWSSPFGGKVISSMEEIIPIMETGYGRVDWECDYKYDGKNTITITGIPPGWGIETKIATIAKEPYIAECAEQTDRGGLKIIIRFKRTDEEQMEENLHKFKKHLRSAQTVSLNCIVRSVTDSDGFRETHSDFQKRSVIEVLKEWYAWRITLEKKALTFEAKLIKESLERDKLLEKTINNLKVIFELLQKKGIDKVKELSKKLDISEEDSKFIWSIAVGRLDRLNMDSVKDSMDKSRKRLKQLKSKFSDPESSVYEQLSGMKLAA